MLAGLLEGPQPLFLPPGPQLGQLQANAWHLDHHPGEAPRPSWRGWEGPVGGKQFSGIKYQLTHTHNFRRTSCSGLLSILQMICPHPDPYDLI